mmetsp:Transcript_26959/g.66088  ORF Transcript_26959/g.66088 Transcript_26959/m.66088 type:complete len:226 (-) Transcript_26959:15-692(-)
MVDAPRHAASASATAAAHRPRGRRSRGAQMREHMRWLLLLLGGPAARRREVHPARVRRRHSEQVVAQRKPVGAAAVSLPVLFEQKTAEWVVRVQPFPQLEPVHVTTPATDPARLQRRGRRRVANQLLGPGPLGRAHVEGAEGGRAGLALARIPRQLRLDGNPLVSHSELVCGVNGDIAAAAEVGTVRGAEPRRGREVAVLAVGLGRHAAVFRSFVVSSTRVLVAG